jgi:hypothetical protein
MDETIADASNIELYMMFTDFNKLGAIEQGTKKRMKYRLKKSI